MFFFKKSSLLSTCLGSYFSSYYHPYLHCRIFTVMYNAHFVQCTCPEYMFLFTCRTFNCYLLLTWWWKRGGELRAEGFWMDRGGYGEDKWVLWSNKGCMIENKNKPRFKKSKKKILLNDNFFLFLVFFFFTLQLLISCFCFHYVPFFPSFLLFIAVLLFLFISIIKLFVHIHMLAIAGKTAGPNSLII